MKKLSPIIPRKLYWAADKVPAKKKGYWFSIDETLVYDPHCKDFGPLDLTATHKYCELLRTLLETHSVVVHFTSSDAEKKANAAYLLGAFQVLVLKKSAAEAMLPLQKFSPFLPFRDATDGPCSFRCTVFHCLSALERTTALGWFSFETGIGDAPANWIIPGKLLAFASPSPTSRVNRGVKIWSPEDFVPVFLSLGVSAVVRLNSKVYEATRFKKRGIQHYDLGFPDCGCPSAELVEEFLSIVEREKVVAVHCKAGLGRTGTMIGCYAVTHYAISAVEFIAWARLVRPGSVMGPQQDFLVNFEKEHALQSLAASVGE